MSPRNPDSSFSNSEPFRPASDRNGALAPITLAGAPSVVGFGPTLLSDMTDLTGSALLRALRRRWLHALCYGVAAAAMAATLTCLVLPTKYTAQALVHVA